MPRRTRYAQLAQQLQDHERKIAALRELIRLREQGAPAAVIRLLADDVVTHDRAPRRRTSRSR